MKALRSRTAFPPKSSVSEQTQKISIFLFVFVLIFFVLWLANYSWTIITTPYPAEYREGAILLLTDFLMQGINPFTLEHHPLMTNNYGFLYNLVVLPSAIMFGNTLAVHRTISILFILASCIVVGLTLSKGGTVLPFAFGGGALLMASLLFTVTPLARPDGLGEFFFLLTVLFPWHRKFDVFSLVASGLTGILAFLAKPYFLLSVGIVSIYVMVFVSKRRGLFYALSVASTLIILLYVINIFLESYFLDTILNNIGNSRLSNAHMLQQLGLFIKAFLPASLILLLAVKKNSPLLFLQRSRLFREDRILDITNFDQPLIRFPIDYFWFFLACTFTTVVFLLGKHSGAYMSYFFQLVAPALILVIFQQKDVLQKKAAITAPLILINLYLICFWVLYPNKLSVSEQQEWEKLYRYVASSTSILNSPVLVPEMIRLNRMPVDSGQSEYYFYTQPYEANPFAPDYKKVAQLGRKYLNSVRIKVQNKKYDYVIVTAQQGFSPFAGHVLIDRFYDQVELIHIAMPQTDEYWTIEVNSPQTD
jgi:hypothetical protein